MLTTIYSILHFLVDGVCAIAMFGWFTEGEQGYINILIYNFCAFALQMPLGTMLDLVMVQQAGTRPSEKYPFIYASVGVVLTLVGAFTHPLVLGVGNALFHLGGGVDVIREDRQRGWSGRGLGVFVAPGAMGLYLGGLIADGTAAVQWIGLATAGAIMLALLFLIRKYMAGTNRLQRMRMGVMKGNTPNIKLLLAVCFLVVILRSYVGMAVTFPWKTTMVTGLISVLAVVLGKMAGGFLAAGFGRKKVIILSLLPAVVCFAFSEQMFIGLFALFLFNMTMPITLHLLVERLPQLPGFSFGLLTFGLFLGFLPVYLEWNLSLAGTVVGAGGSLISLILLLFAVGWRKGGVPDGRVSD